MTWRVLLLSVVCCLFLTPESYAGWTFHHRSPEIEEIDDEMSRFVAVRIPPESDAKLDRSARLTISDGERKILEMSIKPTISESGALVYEFKVAKQYLHHTKLEIFEKEKDKKHIVGGGDIYGYSVGHPYLKDLIELKSESSR